MNKKILYLISILAIFILSMICFLPKKSLYFFAEESLKKENIIISNEIISETPLSLHIKKGKIFYYDEQIGNFDSLKSYLYIFHNKIELSNIDLNINQEDVIIDKLTLFYWIGNPTKIYIEGIGNLGEIEGFINLLHNEILFKVAKTSILLKEANLIDGYYKYEYK